jgi:hypothetical protein
MFGHDDSKNDDHQQPEHDAVLGDDASMVHPDATNHQDDLATPAVSPAFTAAPPMPANNDNNDDDKPADDTGSDIVDQAAKALPDTLDNSDHSELLDLKQSALKQLSPLVDHLDQTPEEKFRTTMMMIQASDDQRLLKDAYEAAQKITDEKTKAQALLDIVNEINYFTHHS